MTDSHKDNLVLFPKTLDYYQIQLTRMLETERYGDAKALLEFLLQCGGEAEKHHVEWQALLGWLEAAFPEAGEGRLPDGLDGFEEAEDDLRRRLNERAEADADYVPRLLRTLIETDDPEQQMLMLGQLSHLDHPDVEPSLLRFLESDERYPSVQFKALQLLRKSGLTGPVRIGRDGEWLTVEVETTPLSYEEFPASVQRVLERVRMAAEVSDPTLSYFAEEMWKECVQVAYGTSAYARMASDDDTSCDLWAAALHQFLIEKLHGRQNDEDIREQYGITDELRFQYEQSLRWMRQFAGEPGPVS
ncbi:MULTISPECIES: hypothetical protein [Cohnella]|uniref:hypothetical protein n=1 Tax=Cohnella TaxID=329857 RepID=UPI0009B9EC83|nr:MULTISPECIES: hypothetical protein [Cohnella]MBN2984879.1 hypothetical protein [Cohnella algarum]